MKKSTKLKKSFYDDGLGDLLDFCDENKREEIVKKESMHRTWMLPRFI